AQPRRRPRPQHPDPQRGTGGRAAAFPYRRRHRRRLRPRARARRNPRQGPRHAAGAGGAGMTARIFRGREELAAVAPDDRGLAYGDGVFETMRVHRGEVPWWDAHWRRLALGASRLQIALPPARQAREVARALFDDAGDGVLKLLLSRGAGGRDGGRRPPLSRGAGGRGYARPAKSVPTWILSRHPLPRPARGGVSLHWCDVRLAVQPALAGIKHCNRLEQVLARAECDRAG